MPVLANEVDTILHKAATMAAEWLNGHGDRKHKVVEWRSPAELAAELGDLAPRAGGRPLEELLGECRRILARSVRTGHPGFANQLYGGWDLAGLLGEWMTALLDTSMYTYEVAPVLTLIEAEVVKTLARKAGFPDGEGAFAPGGSLANLMAALVARDEKWPQARRKGMPVGVRPVLFVSREAHYSVARAAAVLGLGTDAVRMVDVDARGCMRPRALDRALQIARARGERPFLVVATAGTTVAGAGDPVAPLAALAHDAGAWLHVDASYGGGVLFSEERRALMHGSGQADSLSLNPHKLLGVPISCSVLLMRERGRLRAAHGMQADYLFHGDPEQTCDRGDLSLQCGRRADALKLWMAWQAHGDAGFGQRVDRLFALATAMRDRVRARAAFELVREPQGCNICFRMLPHSLRRAPASENRSAQLEVATLALRERLIREGRHMVNYAPVDGAVAFRWVANNPEVRASDLDRLLDDLERLGADL